MCPLRDWDVTHHGERRIEFNIKGNTYSTNMASVGAADILHGQ